MVWVRFVVVVYLISLGFLGILVRFRLQIFPSKLHHILGHLDYTQVVGFFNILEVGIVFQAAFNPTNCQTFWSLSLQLLSPVSDVLDVFYPTVKASLGREF